MNIAAATAIKEFIVLVTEYTSYLSCMTQLVKMFLCPCGACSFFFYIFHVYLMSVLLNSWHLVSKYNLLKFEQFNTVKLMKDRLVGLVVSMSDY